MRRGLAPLENLTVCRSNFRAPHDDTARAYCGIGSKS